MELFFWEVARASGLAAYVALCIAVLTGLAPRTQALGFLATNRAVRALHDWSPWIVLPAAITHVVALVLDATARISLVDLLAFEVPHLLVATQVREGVVRLANLVLGGERRARGEERHRDVVGMLRAHRARRATRVGLRRSRGRGCRLSHRPTLGRT